MARRLKGSAFTVVLLGSVALLTFASWEALTYFPVQWGWPMGFKRTGLTGRGGWNSAFVMFSLASGILAGMSVTDKIHRGWKESPGLLLLLLPFGSAALAIAATRTLELAGRLDRSPTMHHALMGFWLLNFVVVRLAFWVASRLQRHSASLGK